MQEVDELAKLLRSGIVTLDDIQKQLAKLPPAEESKTNLLKEFIALSFASAENVLLSANMLVFNYESTSEEILQFAVEQSRALFEGINRLPR